MNRHLGDRIKDLDDWLPRELAEGKTSKEIAKHMRCSRATVSWIIHEHRNTLGPNSEPALLRTLVAQGTIRSYMYWLSVDPVEIRKYVDLRIGEVEPQIITIQKVCERAVLATDERSVAGRKARYLARQFSRILEDLDMMKEDA
jgi:hypothetical protein